MRRSFLIPISVGMILAWGCNTDRRAATDETGRTPAGTEQRRDEKAYVRVVNAMPSATPVDVSAGDNTTFSSVTPKSATPYREVPDERMTFRVRPVGATTGEPLAEDSAGLGGGKYYTAIILGDENNKAQIKMVEDVTNPPDQGKAKIRMVHAATGVGDLDMFVTGRNEALIDGVDIKDETRYVQVDPILGDIEIRRDDNNKVIGRMSAAKIEAGKAHTIVVTGKEPNLSVVMLEDKIDGDHRVTPTTPAPTTGGAS